MESLSQTILSECEKLPKGSVITAKDFLHLANRAAVDKSLSRLVLDEKMIRVCRGLYVCPIYTSFGSHPPSTESVLQSIASRFHVSIVTTGTSEANILGLSTQVPIREVFLTSGLPRILRLGALSIELKHGQGWQLALGMTLSGRIVRALGSMGPQNAPQAWESLQARNDVSISDEDRRAIASLRPLMPGWLAVIFNGIRGM